MKITRLDLLKCGAKNAAIETFRLWMKLCPDIETIRSLANTPLDDVELAPFLADAKTRNYSLYRELFREQDPKMVAEWERLEAERAKRNEYIAKGIPYEILEDGTVIKREQTNSE